MDPLNFGVGEDNADAPTPIDTENEESLLNGFLKDIPEQDRPIVAKYAKTWDGNVTRKFQDIHKQYEPYKELGDIEAIKAAVSFATFVNQDPVTSYKAMEQALRETYGDEFDTVMAQVLQEQEENEMNEEEYDDEEEYEDDDPDNEVIQQLGSTVDELLSWKEQQEQALRDQEDFAQFDNFMRDMHNQYGDFDDQWVTMQIANGMEPVKAVEAYNSFVENLISSRKNKPAPPPILGGQGGVPNDQVDVSTLKGQDRRKLVENLLNASKE